jgi:Tfp pilus assembly protein PilX
MTPRHLADLLRDQRGVALPLAMLALVVMTMLIIGFSVLSASEPNIAYNQMRVAQARAIAEAGMERAIWALNNPLDASGITNPLVLAPAPYDGLMLVNVAYNGVNIGGFRVTVSNGVAANERNIVSDGWVPNDTATNRAKQRVTVTVFMVRFPEFPSALAVRGEVGVGGHATVDSRSDTSCGNKLGVFATDNVDISGSGRVYGAVDGNNTANEATDYTQSQPAAAFDALAWTNAELDALKAIARANGTYYQGSVTFNSGNPLPNGLIFVDTTDGQNIDVNGEGTTPADHFANVDILGNAAANATGIFHGWIVSNGAVSISGNFQMQGLVYAQDDFNYLATGPGQIQGAVASRNIRDTSSTNIDKDTGGNSLILYNCSMAKTGGGKLPQNFRIKPGTYKEVSG